MRTKILLPSLLVALLFTTRITPAKAQSIEILGGNVLNGAMTGTILGGAAMALRNSNDFAPLRIGLGSGTLYGMGVGIYDLSKTSVGQSYFVSGVFNDGNNTSIIVLLDTIYGTAAGAIVASSIYLIADKEITGALQYGSAIGAFTGFAFGLVDGFILAQKPGEFDPPTAPSPSQPGGTDSELGGGGMFSYNSSTRRYRIDFITPAAYATADIGRSTAGVKIVPGVDLVSLNVRF